MRPTEIETRPHCEGHAASGAPFSELAQLSFDLASLPQATRPYQMWATPSVDVVASAGVVSGQRAGGGAYTQA